jgi:hypothetical protein
MYIRRSLSCFKELRLKKCRLILKISAWSAAEQKFQLKGFFGRNNCGEFFYATEEFGNCTFETLKAGPFRRQTKNCFAIRNGLAFTLSCEQFANWLAEVSTLTLDETDLSKLTKTVLLPSSQLKGYTYIDRVTR